MNILEHPTLLLKKRVFLVDMNGTFMFGGDRFGLHEDYSRYYRNIGGELSHSAINAIVRGVYEYLELKYEDPAYRECFPSIRSAISETIGYRIPQDEIERIISTFAHHELGFIPPQYVSMLGALSRHYMLTAVVDIWSPKRKWLEVFEQTGVDRLFRMAVFSSDHGCVKPSRYPYDQILDGLAVSASDALVIGDSPSRDLEGALAAGIDCVLVGGATDPGALGSFENLLELGKWILALT